MSIRDLRVVVLVLVVKSNLCNVVLVVLGKGAKIKKYKKVVPGPLRGRGGLQK